MNGCNLVRGLDYKGAIGQFEKALEVNPRSSAAHFELGLIYGEQIKDYAAAIYHLQQHLKLRPTSEYADRINGLVRTYKTELFKSEFVAPMNVGLQRDLERLTTENTSLKRQIELLQAQLGVRQVLATNAAPQPALRSPGAGADNRTALNNTQPASSVRPTPAGPTPRARNYTVKSGDTITSIAKDCGVKINSLLQANPGIDPRRLKVGQTLAVPAS